MKVGFGVCLSFLILSCAAGLRPQQFTPAFTVLNPENPPQFPAHWRIAVSSDPHILSKSSNLDATRNILRYAETEYQKGALNAFFILGDFVDYGGDRSSWTAVRDAFSNYAPSIPILGLAGNHDIYGFGLGNWHYVIRTTDPSNSEPYWRLDIGDTHFLGLFLPWSFHDFDPRQKLWLKTQLAGIPASDFVIILTHSFFYASGYYDFWSGGAWFDNKGNISKVAPIFSDRANLVVSGHNHYMEWLETNGISWAIVGAMGGKPDPVPTYTSKGSVFFKRATFGFLLIERDDSGLVCSFRDTAGKLLFTRTITKH